MNNFASVQDIVQIKNKQTDVEIFWQAYHKGKRTL